MFCWRFMVAPIAQLVSIGTQLTEAMAGLDRTTEILEVNGEEDAEPGAPGCSAGDACARRRGISGNM